jgi:hypothetical protein
LIGSVSFQLTSRVKDEKLNIDDLQYYCLSMLIGTERFQCCVTDVRNNLCLLLEDYVIEGVNSPFEHKQVLQAIFEDHHLLMAGFWHSVKIAFSNSKFTLVPVSLFDENHMGDYLKYASTLDEKEDELFYYKQIHAKAVNVFAVEREVIDWLRNQVYPTLQLQIMHQSSALIEGVLTYEGRQKRLQTIGVFIEENKLHITVGRNKHLEYHNQFTYTTPQKAVHYLLLVMKELELSPESSPVNLWGDIEFDTPLFQEFYRYIRSIAFGHRPSHLKFRYFFDELKDHQYFDLYNICLCE